MKLQVIVCVMAAAVFGQESEPQQDRAETAADLFYKAFWLEQADGDPARAFALYGRVVKKHATCPEAPRAVLGMARIDHARGKQVTAYVKLLEAKYPGAKRELGEARKLATARKAAFSPTFDSKDSPLVRKIKACYSQLAHHLPNPDREFLVEVRETAHPMLAASLRRDQYNPVHNAATILVAQKSKTAYAVLETALRDKNVIFKTAIVHALQTVELDSPDLARAMVAIGARSSPSLRATIASTMARMTLVPGATREIAYEFCTKALFEKEASVRRAAAAASMTASYALDSYVSARLERMEKNDVVYSDAHYAGLTLLANRKQHAERARALLVRHRFRNYRFKADPGQAEGALMLASVAVEWHRKRPDGATRSALEVASRYSNAAAAFTLKKAIDTQQTNVAWYAAEGMRKAIHPGTTYRYSALRDSFTDEYRRYLGTHADEVVRHALRASFDADLGRQGVASTVLAAIGLGPNAERLIVEACRAHPRSALPGFVFSKATMQRLGPEKMARVAVLSRNEQEYNQFLRAGVKVFLAGKRELAAQQSVAFFRVVVPKVGPAALPALNFTATAHRALVAHKFLLSKGKEWNWDRRGGPDWNQYFMVEVCKQPQLVALTLRSTRDSRLPVAQTAITVASQLPSEEATQALARGLDAPTPQLRAKARNALSRRGDGGVDLLIKRTQWDKLPGEELAGCLMAVSAGKQARHRDHLRALLEKKQARWADAWPAYFRAAPRDAVELALKTALATKDHAWRLRAVEVLTRSPDPRRIAVFRAVLTSETDHVGLLQLVVKTASDQYLIELGPEVLKQLRSPHKPIRDAATEAIERLKFYADAQKTFLEQDRKLREGR